MTRVTLCIVAVCLIQLVSSANIHMCNELDVSACHLPCPYGTVNDCQSGLCTCKLTGQLCTDREGCLKACGHRHAECYGNTCHCT
ncbi:hypothetical protein KP79_PYT15997 [Mizuhopecten yessoensis]|uniref:Uncharacterized protein n=1 Tax=Mizuhopecten yessoensis TaxID=6573 RepID=A0A210PWX1_MIZYE|nr:hypothetical protein KP79_PYT15997 [Mizuhopecten yessoensis]